MPAPGWLLLAIILLASLAVWWRTRPFKEE